MARLPGWGPISAPCTHPRGRTQELRAQLKLNQRELDDLQVQHDAARVIAAPGLGVRWFAKGRHGENRSTLARPQSPDTAGAGAGVQGGAPMPRPQPRQVEQRRRLRQRLLGHTHGVPALYQTPLLLHVLSFLPLRTVLRLAPVCRMWRALPLRHDLALWRQAVSRPGGVPPSLRPALWLALGSAEAGDQWHAAAVGVPVPPGVAPSTRLPPALWPQGGAVAQGTPLACALPSGSAVPHITVRLRWSALPRPIARWAAGPDTPPAAFGELPVGDAALQPSAECLVAAALSVAAAAERVAAADATLASLQRDVAQVQGEEAALLDKAAAVSLQDVSASAATGAPLPRASSAQWGACRDQRFHSAPAAAPAPDTATEVEEEEDEGGEGVDPPVVEGGADGDQTPSLEPVSTPRSGSLWGRLTALRRRSADSQQGTGAPHESGLQNVTQQTRAVTGSRAKRGKRAAPGNQGRGSPHPDAVDVVGLRGNVGITPDMLAASKTGQSQASPPEAPPPEAFLGATGAGDAAMNASLRQAHTPPVFTEVTGTAEQEGEDMGFHSRVRGVSSEVPLGVPVASGMQAAEPGVVVAGHHGLEPAEVDKWTAIQDTLKILHAEEAAARGDRDAAEAQLGEAVSCLRSAAVGCIAATEPRMLRGAYGIEVPAPGALVALVDGNAAEIPASAAAWTVPHAQVDADVQRTFGEVLRCHRRRLEAAGQCLDDEQESQAMEPGPGDAIPPISAHESMSMASVAAARAALRRVLLAFSVLEPRVGYCQGMNFVTALLLRVFNGDEQAALWMLFVFVQRYGLRRVYSSGLQGAGLAFAQMDAQLAVSLPQLSLRLAQQEISASMYSAGWFMTLFASGSTLPLQAVTRVWDLWLVEGWSALHRTALALLGLSAGQLLGSDFMVNVQFLLTALPQVLRDCVAARRLAAGGAAATSSAAAAAAGEGGAATSAMDAQVLSEDMEFGAAAADIVMAKALDYNVRPQSLLAVAAASVAASQGVPGEVLTQTPSVFGGAAAVLGVEKIAQSA